MPGECSLGQHLSRLNLRSLEYGVLPALATLWQGHLRVGSQIVVVACNKCETTHRSPCKMDTDKMKACKHSISLA